MYRSKRKMDREQLIFAAEVIMAGADDVLRSQLPCNPDMKADDVGPNGAVFWSTGMALAVLYAQYNPEGDGLGVGDALDACGHQDAWEEFIQECWHDGGTAVRNRQAKLRERPNGSWHESELYPTIPDGRKLAEKFVDAVFDSTWMAEDAIYIIVENVPSTDDGEYTVEEAICAKLGFYTDPNAAEGKVNELNQKYLESKGYTQDQIDDDELQEEHRDRFGFIPLQPSNAEDRRLCADRI